MFQGRCDGVMVCRYIVLLSDLGLRFVRASSSAQGYGLQNGTERNIVEKLNDTLFS